MQEDTQRALAVAKQIIDDRDQTQHAAIMVTVEHAVTAVLLTLYGDPRMAAGMLNEALVPGIEARLSRYGVKVPAG